MGEHAIREDWPQTSQHRPTPDPTPEWWNDLVDGHQGPAKTDSGPKVDPPRPVVVDPAIYGIDKDDVAPAAPTPGSQLHASHKNVTFHGVAGIAALPQELMLTNESKNGVGVRMTIHGPHAAMFTHSHALGAIVPPMRANALPEPVAVTYRPTAPGHHTATLVLTSDAGITHVNLVGDAMESRPGGAAKTAPNTPEHAREQALEAATNAAHLASDYTKATASTDAARDALAARILGAGTKLNAKLVGWLAEEGTTAAHATEQKSRVSNATDAAKFVAIEVAEVGLEAAAMSNPISAAAMIAVDLGWDMVEAGMDNDGAAAQRRETVGRLESVGAWAAAANTDVTRQLVQRYSSLMSSYDVAKAELHGAANVNDEIGNLHERLANGESAEPATKKLREVQSTYRTRLDHLHLVLRTIAAEAAQAEPRATQAFAALMDRYLRYRASGDADAPAHVREIVTTGYLLPSSSPPVGLTGTRIGAVDASTLGPSVVYVATHRPLADMAGWNVTIRLATSDGELALHQLATGDRVQVIPDAMMSDVNQIGGIAALWSAVDRARVGK